MVKRTPIIHWTFSFIASRTRHREFTYFSVSILFWLIIYTWDFCFTQTSKCIHKYSRFGAFVLCDLHTQCQNPNVENTPLYPSLVMYLYGLLIVRPYLRYIIEAWKIKSETHRFVLKQRPTKMSLLILVFKRERHS